MSLSVFDLFKIGIGPSSSHTVGPMLAAGRFAEGLRRDALLASTERIKVELYGSLGATGKGHGSDTAVLLGLEGEQPDTVDTASVPARLAQIRSSGQVRLLGEKPIAFVEKQHLNMVRKPLPFHPNGMIFRAFDAAGLQLCSREYYSVGGGFVVDEQAAGAGRVVEDSTALHYPFTTGKQLLAHCSAHNLSISQVMLANEAADAVNQGVCDAASVDVAMRQGVNYPCGPLAWADAMGLPTVNRVLCNLGLTYGEDRYRVSPLIQHKVFSGKNFHG